jgi:hypothetical protein
VYHEPLVGMPDRIADPHHQPDAIPQGEPALLDPSVDGLSFDVLHDEVRKPIHSGSPVDERGDAGVGQTGEHAAFQAEPLGQPFGGQAGSDQFEGEPRLEVLALAHDLEDDAHAAAADLADQPPRAHLPAFHRPFEGLMDGMVKSEHGVFEEILRARILIQQVEHLAADLSVAALAFEPGAAPVRGHLKGLAEEPVHFLPRPSVHGVSSFLAGPGPAARQAAVDPGLGQHPVALHGCRRDAENARLLLYSEAAGETHLDDAGLLGTELLQLGEGRVQIQKIHRLRARDAGGLIQDHPLLPAWQSHAPGGSRRGCRG